MPSSSTLIELDARIAALAPGLKSDDLTEVERCRRAINAWLDNRLDLMAVLESEPVTPPVLSG